MVLFAGCTRCQSIKKICIFASQCAAHTAAVILTLNQSADVGTGTSVCASCRQLLSRGMPLALSASTTQYSMPNLPIIHCSLIHTSILTLSAPCRLMLQCLRGSVQQSQSMSEHLAGYSVASLVSQIDHHEGVTMCTHVERTAYLEAALASPTMSWPRVSTIAERYMSAADHRASRGQSSLSCRLVLTSLSALLVSCQAQLLQAACEETWLSSCRLNLSAMQAALVCNTAPVHQLACKRKLLLSCGSVLTANRGHQCP